jgi:hypothetical protein
MGAGRRRRDRRVDRLARFAHSPRGQNQRGTLHARPAARPAARTAAGRAHRRRGAPGVAEPDPRDAGGRVRRKRHRAGRPQRAPRHRPAGRDPR